MRPLLNISLVLPFLLNLAFFSPPPPQTSPTPTPRSNQSAPTPPVPREPLNLDSQSASQFQNSQKLLSEVRFRFAPGIDKLDLATWLKEVNPGILDCSMTVDSANQNFSAAVMAVAYHSGVNPRVLLTLAELAHQVLSDPAPDCASLKSYGDQLLEMGQSMIDASAAFRFNDFERDGFKASPYALERIDELRTDVSFAIAQAAGLLTNKSSTASENEADFYSIYSHYFGDPESEPQELQTFIDASDSVEFKMPYSPWENPRYYTGGPHGGGTTASCAQVPLSDVSGLDFSGPGAETGVYSLADGEIVGVKTTDTSPGKWVAVLHSNGIVSMYWHLKSIDETIKREYVDRQHSVQVFQGTYLGERSNTGCPGCDEHWHIELRSGGYNYNIWNGIGLPVSWNGMDLDGWEIFAERYSNGKAVNYNGTALSTSTPYSKDQTIMTNCGQAYARVDPGFSFDYEQNTSLTKFAFSSWTSALPSTTSPT